MLERLLQYDFKVSDDGRDFTLETRIAELEYKKEFPKTKLTDTSTVLHLIKLEYCPEGECQALIPRLALDDPENEYGYQIPESDLDPELFNVQHYIFLHKFYSYVRSETLSTREYEFFSGSATKLLLWVLQEIMLRRVLEKPLYFALEASGKDMRWLVRLKYPSMGLRPMTTSKMEVDRLIREEWVPMFGRFKTVLQHLQNFATSENVSYCIQCMEYPVKFEGIKYCSTYCQLS